MLPHTRSITVTCPKPTIITHVSKLHKQAYISVGVSYVSIHARPHGVVVGVLGVRELFQKILTVTFFRNHPRNHQISG